MSANYTHELDTFDDLFQKFNEWLTKLFSYVNADEHPARMFNMWYVNLNFVF